MYILYSGLSTLQELEVIESQRDKWQRPSEVIAALNLQEGSVVADVGSGAGYFALKLSRSVGVRGKVLAVDLRKLSLSFLWIRAALRRPHNIHIILAEPDDPHLPAEGADAVLIANTYHEFTNSGLMLDHVLRALRTGGRVVILDRSPHIEGTSAIPERESTIAPETAVTELQRHGFGILTRDDRFIDRLNTDIWWLVVATK